MVFLSPSSAALAIAAPPPSSSTFSPVKSPRHDKRPSDRKPFGMVWALLLALVMVTLFDGLSGAKLPLERRVRHHKSDKTPVFHVDDKDDARHYLQKYGYLEHCIPHYRQLKKAIEYTRHGLPITEGQQLRLCTPMEEKRALKALQETFDLKPTGKWDGQTKRLMEARRCGNSDSSDPLAASKRRRKRSVLAGSDSSAAVDRDDRSSSRSNDNNSYIHSDDVDGNQDINPNNGERLERSTRFTGVGGRLWNRGPWGTSQPEEKYYNESSKQLRTDMFNRFKKDFAGETNQSRDANDTQENSTTNGLEPDEEMTVDSLRKIQEARRRRRKKRSIKIDGSPAYDMGILYDANDDRLSRYRVNDTYAFKWRLITGLTGSIPLVDQKAAIVMAFRMWSECAPIRFMETSHAHVMDVDILVAFAKREHMNCDRPFDGLGGEVAHSWAAGDVHFDADENFKRKSNAKGAVDLMKVAVHEVGHVLGLLHKEDRRSIMFPIYNYLDNELEIPVIDRSSVQQIYGVCKGRFDAVFDLVIAEMDKYVYTSYFFRGGTFWVYSNEHKKTRLGSPHTIEKDWPGLPTTGIDTFLQLGEGFRTFFFAGENYYRLKPNTTRVLPDYPQKISDLLRVSPEVKPITEDIDATFEYVNLYIFKGDWVWICNASLVGENNCCYKREKIIDIFPTDTQDTQLELTGNIDAVYYSFKEQGDYFFKGDTYYLLEISGDKFLLHPMGQWSDKWRDICEVSM